MIKLERKFLYTFADIAAAKKLIGKKGIFFDSFILDDELINKELFELLSVEQDNKTESYKNSQNTWRFFYHDPNLECKRAFYLEGKEIQSRVKNSACKDWDNCPRPTWDDGIEYRIKPETKEETFLTYKEVAEWLMKGNGQWREDLGCVNLIHPSLCYHDTCENDSFPHLLRKWSDSEWHEATREYVSEVAE